MPNAHRHGRSFSPVVIHGNWSRRPIIRTCSQPSLAVMWRCWWLMATPPATPAKAGGLAWPMMLLARDATSPAKLGLLRKQNRRQVLFPITITQATSPPFLTLLRKVSRGVFGMVPLSLIGPTRRAWACAWARSLAILTTYQPSGRTTPRRAVICSITR